MNNKDFDQIAYQNAYNKEKYDRITLMLPKGQKELLLEEAKKRGFSNVTALMKDMIKKEFNL